METPDSGRALRVTPGKATKTLEQQQWLLIPSMYFNSELFSEFKRIINSECKLTALVMHHNNKWSISYLVEQLLQKLRRFDEPF